MFYISVKLIGEHCCWLLAIGCQCQSSTVPEPVEGKARRFDELSDRRVQTNKSAATPSAKSIPLSVRMKLLSFINIIPESKYFLMFFKKL